MGPDAAHRLHLPLVGSACKLRMGCWCQKLLTAALFLAYSTAKYCAPVRCCRTHTRIIKSSNGCLETRFLKSWSRLGLGPLLLKSRPRHCCDVGKLHRGCKYLMIFGKSSYLYVFSHLGVMALFDISL